MRIRHVIALLASLTLIPTMAAAERDYGTAPGGGRSAPLDWTFGDFKLTLSGRAQTQAALYVGDEARLEDGVPAEEPGFRLRRVRLGVEGTYGKYLTIGIEIDPLQSEGRALFEAYIGSEGPYWQAFVGMVKVPYSRAARLSTLDLPFAERATGITAIAPFHQLGLLLGGKAWDEKVRLDFGVFNGLEYGSSSLGGWTQLDPLQGNRFGGVAIAARFEFDPIGKMTAGSSDLDWAKKPLLGLGGGVLYNHGETIRTLGFGGDLQFKWYGAALLIEFLQMSREPVETPTSPTNQITPVKQRTLLVEASYAPIAQWLDLAFRFEMVDDNLELKDEGDFFGIGAAVTGTLFKGHLKVQAHYQHRRERSGLALDNDVFLLNVEGRF